MWESKFVPDINPETTLEEMEGRAKTLKKTGGKKVWNIREGYPGNDRQNFLRGSRREHSER